MRRHVHPMLTLYAMALSAGLIGLALNGVDVARIARAALGLTVLGLAGVIVMGLIAGLLRR